MSMIRAFANKISILFGRDRFRSELDEEMAFHREQAEREFLAGGMTPESARYAAMRQFGNPTRLREESHAVVGFRLEWHRICASRSGNCARIQDSPSPRF